MDRKVFSGLLNITTYCARFRCSFHAQFVLYTTSHSSVVSFWQQGPCWLDILVERLFSTYSVSKPNYPAVSDTLFQKQHPLRCWEQCISWLQVINWNLKSTTVSSCTSHLFTMICTYRTNAFHTSVQSSMCLEPDSTPVNDGWMLFGRPKNVFYSVWIPAWLQLEEHSYRKEHFSHESQSRRAHPSLTHAVRKNVAWTPRETEQGGDGLTHSAGSAHHASVMITFGSPACTAAVYPTEEKAAVFNSTGSQKRHFQRSLISAPVNKTALAIKVAHPRAKTHLHIRLFTLITQTQNLLFINSLK